MTEAHSFFEFDNSTESTPISLNCRILLSFQLPNNWVGTKWNLQARQTPDSEWGPYCELDGVPLIPKGLSTTSAAKNEVYHFDPVVGLHEVRLAGASQQTCIVEAKVCTFGSQ